MPTIPKNLVPGARTIEAPYIAAASVTPRQTSETPRPDRVDVDAKSVPTGTARDESVSRLAGDSVQAALQTLVPAPLAPALFGFVIPQMLRESEQSTSLFGRNQIRLQGSMTLLQDGSCYRLRPTDNSSGLQIAGGGRSLAIELDTSRPQAPEIALRAEGRSTSLTADALREAMATYPRMDVREPLPDQLTLQSERRDAAVFCGITPDTTRDAIPPAGPSNKRVFEIPDEDVKISGFRHTNEISANFTSFSIRGGAYLGVGSTQNYDHITTLRADFAFLTDADPRVASDHRGLLALVGQSRNAVHFLSMLAGVPLKPKAEELPVKEAVKLICVLGSNRAFQKQTEEALKQKLPASVFSNVQKVMRDGRNFFLPCWQHQIAKGNHRWLVEPARFQHLQFLQRSGRISVNLANLVGETTLPAIAEQIARWNKSHDTPLEFSAIYLSNAEQWINNGQSKGKSGYAGLVRNLLALPLHPEGVILRTGSFEKTSPKGGDLWKYMTLPMERFVTAARQDTAKASYTAINRRVKGVDIEQADAERKREAGTISNLVQMAVQHGFERAALPDGLTAEIAAITDQGWRFYRGDVEVTPNPVLAALTLRQEQVHVSHPDDPALRYKLKSADWPTLSNRMKGTPENEIEARQMDLLAQLGEKGVTFEVPSDKRGLVPASLRAAVLAYPSARLNLPRRVRWGILYRKQITPVGVRQLEKLNRRLS